MNLKTKDNLKKTKNIDNEKAELLKAVVTLRTELACTHERLNAETDATMIDGYIYEVQSLNLKYKYYLNLCKERGFVLELLPPEDKYAKQP